MCRLSKRVTSELTAARDLLTSTLSEHDISVQSLKAGLSQQIHDLRTEVEAATERLQHGADQCTKDVNQVRVSAHQTTLLAAPLR
jgi:methyl-accepting chemotaxis protein